MNPDKTTIERAFDSLAPELATGAAISSHALTAKDTMGVRSTAPS
jgi:hypothetical protein